MQGSAERGPPSLNRLCQDATRRRFDVIAAWSVNRLGRSLQDLVGFHPDHRNQGRCRYRDRAPGDQGRACFSILRKRWQLRRVSQPPP